MNSTRNPMNATRTRTTPERIWSAADYIEYDRRTLLFDQTNAKLESIRSNLKDLLYIRKFLVDRKTHLVSVAATALGELESDAAMGRSPSKQCLWVDAFTRRRENPEPMVSGPANLSGENAYLIGFYIKLITELDRRHDKEEVDDDRD